MTTDGTARRAVVCPCCPEGHLTFFARSNGGALYHCCWCGRYVAGPMPQPIGLCARPAPDHGRRGPVPRGARGRFIAAVLSA